MRLGVSEAIRNNIPASTYAGRGYGLSAGSHMPSPGTGHASITETARAEVNNASMVRSMTHSQAYGYGGPSAGPHRAATSLRAVSMFKHSSWGF